MIDRYRFYVCCILNPITMKISLDCDQCFSKRMTRLFRLVASRNSFFNFEQRVRYHTAPYLPILRSFYIRSQRSIMIRVKDRYKKGSPD